MKQNYMTLDHERRYWGLDEDDSIEQTVLIATLIGPVADWATAQELIQLATLADGRSAADLILRKHAELYPEAVTGKGAHLALSPLRPDRFGEDFISSVVADPGTYERIRMLLLHEGVPDLQLLRQALTVLSAAGLRNDRVAELVLEVFESRPELVDISSAEAVDLVGRKAQPEYVKGFLTHLKTAPDERSEIAGRLALALVDALPASASLNERLVMSTMAAAHLQTAGLLAEAREASQKAVDAALDAEEQNPDENRGIAAELLNGLAEAMWESGRADDAVQPARESVARFRRLASDNDLGHKAKLASALMQLGIILAEGAHDLVGGLSATQEAVDLLRHNAASPSIDQLALAALANHNLGVRLLENGRLSESIEATRQAVEMFRSLTELAPGDYDDRYASSLVNYSSALISLNRGSEALSVALEALDIRRRRPGLKTERRVRDVARALRAAAAAYFATGRVTESRVALVEAVELFRDLARSYPGSYSGILGDAEQELRSLNASEWRVPDIESTPI